MNDKLDAFFEKEYNRLSTDNLNLFNRSIKKARDKEFTIKFFQKHIRANILNICTIEGSLEVYEKMEESYKIGLTMETNIKRLRKYLDKADLLEAIKEKIPNEVILELVDRSIKLDTVMHQLEKSKPTLIAEGNNVSMPIKDWQSFTDSELISFYANAKSNHDFLEFLDGELISVGQQEEKLVNSTLESNDIETNYRQVAAIYLLLDHLGVEEKKKVSKAEIARFLVFLTGKGYHNTYERVLKIFKHGYSESHHEDLRYIRKFFIKLNLLGIAKKIDKILEEE